MIDDMLKMYLDKINQGITELRNDHNIQIESINLKIDSKISDLKEMIIELQQQIKDIQKDYVNDTDLVNITSQLAKFVTKDYCENNKLSITTNNENELKKEELSVKKVVLITTCIGSITAVIISFGEKILNAIT